MTLRTKTDDVLKFRSGRELIYMGGFPGFKQLIDVRAGVNHWQTISRERFILLQETGRATYVEGHWEIVRRLSQGVLITD